VDEIRPFLSICIPTYNRINKLKKLILNILNSPLQDIEVVVVNNASTDNTLEVLSPIKDRRLSIYSNEVNVGGMRNVIMSLSKSSGVYTLFCLDKDWIEIANLSRFMETLSEQKNILCGYCELDTLEEKPNNYFLAGIDGIKHLGYLSKHPSGYFFKTLNLHNLSLFQRFISEKDSFDFCIDLLCTELAAVGESCIVHFPLSFSANFTAKYDTEPPIKTYTYTKDNVFFHPKQRMNELYRYASHLLTLDISIKEQKRLMCDLFRRGLITSTLGYKNIMSNTAICWHYKIKTENITILKLFLIDIEYCKYFVKSDIRISWVEKIYVCLSGHTVLIGKKMASIFLKLRNRLCGVRNGLL
jgi:glycosyltransferase involved in cell wall biosynthesis